MFIILDLFTFSLFFFVFILLVMITSLYLYDSQRKIPSILNIIAISLIVGETLIFVIYLITFIQLFSQDQLYNPKNIPQTPFILAFNYTKVLYIYLTVFFCLQLLKLLHKPMNLTYLKSQIKFYIRKKTFLAVIMVLVPTFPIYFLITFIYIIGLMNGDMGEWSYYLSYESTYSFVGLFYLLFFTIIILALYFFLESNYIDNFKAERIFFIVLLILILVLCSITSIFYTITPIFSLILPIQFIFLIALFIFNFNMVPEPIQYNQINSLDQEINIDKVPYFDDQIIEDQKRKLINLQIETEKKLQFNWIDIAFVSYIIGYLSYLIFTVYKEILFDNFDRYYIHYHYYNSTGGAYINLFPAVLQYFFTSLFWPIFSLSEFLDTNKLLNRYNSFSSFESGASILFSIIQFIITFGLVIIVLFLWRSKKQLVLYYLKERTKLFNVLLLTPLIVHISWILFQVIFSWYLHLPMNILLDLVLVQYVQIEFSFGWNLFLISYLLYIFIMLTGKTDNKLLVAILVIFTLIYLGIFLFLIDFVSKAICSPNFSSCFL